MSAPSSRSMRVGCFFMCFQQGTQSDGAIAYRWANGKASFRPRSNPLARVAGSGRLATRRARLLGARSTPSRGSTDYPWAERLGAQARKQDVALSVHAPLFAFPGHPDERKSIQALGALDRTAGIAAAAGAEIVVIHPGLLARPRPRADARRRGRLAAPLRERLETKGRAVPFGIEVMGRSTNWARWRTASRSPSASNWVRPVIDFAHMHATSDGAYVDADTFATAHRAGRRRDRARRAVPHPLLRHRAGANRNETKHLPYGDGTLRADPLRDALAGFERPATVISESPDEASSDAIQATRSTPARTPGGARRPLPRKRLLPRRGLGRAGSRRSA